MASVWTVVRWCISLGAKFIRVVPKRTAFIVCCTLLSQISMLLASLLPLKVIIMLGSENVPSYFPSFLLEFERNYILALLAGSAIGFFILHQVAEVIIRALTASGSHVLLSKSHKMELFSNQKKIAESAYERFSRALAGGVFVAIAGSGMLWFYPKMALLICAYIVLCFLYLFFSFKLNTRLQENIEIILRQRISFFSSIAVFIAFSALVLDFMFSTPPSVIIAIIFFLLSRQLMGRLAGSLNDFYSLWLQHIRLDAIFFHDKVLRPQKQTIDQKFWTFLQTEQRAEWLPALLKEFVEETEKIHSVEWHPILANGVAAFKVKASEGQYLVKVFDINRTTVAKHEATLMAEEIVGLPGLKWVGASQVSGFQCLLYRMPEGCAVERKQFNEMVDEFRASLFELRLPSGLQGLYTRSKPLLYKRLNKELLERLAVASNDKEQLKQLYSVIDLLPAILQRLAQLPLSLVSPDISVDNVWQTDDERYVFTHWGRWSLEPIGAGWPEAQDKLEELSAYLAQARSRRAFLADVSDTEVELCALLFALENLCNRQRLLQAWELIPEISTRAEALLGINQDVSNG